jgi:hypothetical protein
VCMYCILNCLLCDVLLSQTAGVFCLSVPVALLFTTLLPTCTRTTKKGKSVMRHQNAGRAVTHSHCLRTRSPVLLLHSSLFATAAASAAAPSAAADAAATAQQCHYCCCYCCYCHTVVLQQQYTTECVCACAQTVSFSAMAS